MPPTEAMLGLTSPAEALVRLTAEWTLSHMSKPGGKMASPEDAVIRSFERQACDTGKTCPDECAGRPPARSSLAEQGPQILNQMGSDH